MPLFRATTAVRGEAAAHALSDALDGIEPAPLASEIHDHDDGSGLWDVGGLFDERPDGAALALLAPPHGAPDFTVARVEERDWVAQVRAELTPVEAGRFVVYGSHDRARIGVNRIGLEIEAAEAFGTGHHATTQGCLLALDRLVKPGSGAAGRRHRRRDRRAGDGGGVGLAGGGDRRRHRSAGDADGAGERGGERARRPGRLRHGGGVPAPAAAAPGAPYELVFANILAGPLKRHGAGHAPQPQPGGRRRDPVGDPRAAGAGGLSRLPLLGLRARGDGADRRLGDAGAVPAALSRVAQRRARESANVGDLAPTQTDVGSAARRRGRAAPPRSRGPRFQAVRRVDDCSTAETTRWVVRVPRGSERGVVW